MITVPSHTRNRSSVKIVCVYGKREKENHVHDGYFFFIFAASSEAPTVQPSQPPPYHIIVPVIAVIVVIVLLSIVLVAYLRYLRLKAEPPRMCPVGSVTASLIASTLAPFGLQPVENISSEFPRENLQFLKVLGGYH